MKSKKKISDEWYNITFTKMKGIDERSAKELSRVLKFQKSLMKK